MQNYEELYGALQPLEKALKDSAAAVTKQQKAIQKNTETGNLAEVKKSLEAIAEAAKTLQEGIDAVRSEIDSFDTRAYFADGDFTKQLLEACAEKGVDVRGETGVCEMFPSRSGSSARNTTVRSGSTQSAQLPAFFVGIHSR